MNIELMELDELAFNVSEMGGLFCFVIPCQNIEKLAETIAVYDENAIYKKITYGEREEFERLIRDTNLSTKIIDISDIKSKAEPFLDTLVQFRDRINYSNKIILFGNERLLQDIETQFEQLKGFGLEIYKCLEQSNSPLEDEKKSLESKYGFSSEKLKTQGNEEMPDDEDHNRWQILI